VPAALLAAITGGSLLADEISPVLAGILALVAAGLAGVLATVKAAERGEVCQRVGNEYLALQRDARIARNVDLPSRLRRKPATPWGNWWRGRTT